MASNGLIFTGQIYVTRNKGNILKMLRRCLNSPYRQVLNSSYKHFRLNIYILLRHLIDKTLYT